MLQTLARLQVSALAWRLAFLYAALFFVVGCYLPYMPVWLKWRGLSDDAIAFLLATQLFMRVLFTPAIAFAADWTGARRSMLVLLAWGSLLSFLLLWASANFWQMLQAGSAPPRRLKLSDAASLAHSPSFLLFLVAASAIQSSHALFYAFGTIHWRAQGIADGTIGALWSLGVIAEIALFAVSGRVLASWGAGKLLLAAAIAGIARWSLMAVDPPLFVTFLLQCLHAFSFGAAHLAAMYFLTEAVPDDRSATAQGIYSASVAGLGLGLVTLACGPLYRSLGGEAYAVMALLALVGLLCTALLMRRWHGERVVGPIAVQPQSAGAGGRTVPET